MPKCVPKKRKRKARPRRIATVAPFSDNAKTGPIAVTYVSQVSCPDSCPLRHNGCYAENGPLGLITKRLNESAKAMGADAMDAARAEAELIRATPAFGPMRLHGVGDCATPEAARIVAGASMEYTERGRGFGVSVWTYTHAWRDVPRDNWGTVSVLSSCHSFEECVESMDAGYAASVIVADFPDSHWEVGDGRGGTVNVVACRYQFDGTQCIKCRICFHDTRLLETRTVVAFAAHGVRRKSVLKTLL